jgi:hypothetical protein
MERAITGRIVRRSVESSPGITHGAALERTLGPALLVLAVRFLYGGTATDPTPTST